MTQHLNHVIFGGLNIGGGGILTLSSGLWSTRKVNTEYGGNCLKIRRDGGSPGTQDIGFSGTLLDTTALLSYVGSNNGYVETWYDQSGHARNLAQATEANQPQLVASGSVLTGVGGQPALDFNGTSHYLESSAAFSAFMSDTAGIILVVFNIDVINTTSSNAYNNDGLVADSLGFLGSHLDGSGSVVIAAFGWDGVERKAQSIITTGSDNVHIWRHSHSGSQIRSYLNSSSPAVATLNTISNMAGLLRVGRQYTTSYYDGKIAEIALWDSGLSDGQVTDLGSDAAAYYGITWS